MEEAACYLQRGLGVANVISLGVYEKVSGVVKQVLANLFGIELDLQAAVEWKNVIDAVAYTFQQA